MHENRSQKRFHVSLEAELRSLSSSRKTAFISDINLNGCFINTILPVTEGEIIELGIKLSDGKFFNIKGKVAHIHQHIGFGIRFILNDEQKKILFNLIRDSRQNI